MAQTINILNSVDSLAMTIPTTLNDDEDDGDEHRQLLASSSNINSVPTITTITTTNISIPSPAVAGSVQDENHFYQKKRLSCTNPSASIDSPSDTSNHLPMSNSETSLTQSLINEDHPQTPVYTVHLYAEDERTSSSTASTTDDNAAVIKTHRFMGNYFNDMFISAFLITPLLNIHWRGAWDLLDIHLLPDYPYTSALISLGTGVIMLYFIYLSQGYCQIFYEKKRRSLIGKIMTRFHAIILAFAYIQQWRGVWNLMDLTSNDWYYLLAETVSSVVVLLMMGDIYNLNSAPFLIGVDTESYFIIDSKYQITTKKFLQRSLDFIFYEVIQAPLLIIAWHGLYNLSDSYITPDDKKLSTIISFSSGYGAYFILAIMQIPVLRCLIKLDRSWIYTCVSNIFHLIAFVSVVQIWRSLWLICEQYLNIPGYHDLTLLLCYGGALLVLVCGLTVCSLNGPAGSKDDGIEEKMPPFFQFEYLSTMFRRPNKTSKDTKSNSLSSDVVSSETMVPVEYLCGQEPDSDDLIQN